MKGIRKRILALVMSLVMSLGFSTVTVKAGTVYEADVTVASEGNTIVGLSGVYDYVGKTLILNRINAIRKEAYDEGLVSSYVPMKWSYDLEYMARLLAVDDIFVNSWDERANGGSTWITSNGVGYKTGWHYWNNGGISATIDWFYENKDTKEYTCYDNLINPDYNYIAFAGFRPECFDYNNTNGQYCNVCLFGTGSGLNEEQFTNDASTITQKIEIKNSYINKMNVKYEALSVNVGKEQKLEVTFEAASNCYLSTLFLSASNVSWSSSAPSVVTVDSNGNVKAVKAGKAKITAKCGSFTKSVTMEVGYDVSKFRVDLWDDAVYYTGEKRTPYFSLYYGNDHVPAWDYSVSYKNNINPGEAKLTITGEEDCYGTKTVTFKIVKPAITYSACVQKEGQLPWVGDGGYAGTKGKALRLELIKIQLKNAIGNDYLEYRTYVQKKGWTAWADDGEASGMKDRRLEAFQLRLGGIIKGYYDIYYRVYAQRFGWMGWAKNGQSAGTAGYGYRLEGVQIKLIPKNGQKPSGTTKAFRKKG